MREILNAFKKYKFLFWGGLGIVVFLALLNPVGEFILKISQPAKKGVIQDVIQTDPLWRPFTNIPCKYVISFPSPPFETHYPFTNKVHVASYRQFASVLGSNQVFGVSTLLTTFTNDLSKEQIKFLLDRTMTGAIENGDLLIYKRDITFGTNEGRELEIQKTNKSFLKARYYRIGQDLQMLITSAPPEKEGSTNITYFFNSFSVVQK